MSASFRWLSPTCCVTQSQVFATNTGLFVSGGGATLVDPGIEPHELDAIEAFVADHGATVRGIILTHAHWDHLLGPARFPSATVIAHREFATVIRAHGGDLQRQIRVWRTAAGWGSGEPFVLPKPDLTFDGQVTVHLDDLQLRVIFAPGHAPDHCVVHDPAAGVLWAGDMLSDLEIPLVMDRFSAYRQTLQRLAGLDVRVLIPGHGTPTSDAQELQVRFSQDLGYLDAVWTCVAEAMAQGKSLDETVIYCRGTRLAQPDEYPNAHVWNVEQAFVEMGGASVGPVGWEKEWIS
jgi:glyoxylase-like metal-dependent hydrolase (beta-lactamase superfamily II)